MFGIRFCSVSMFGCELMCVGGCIGVLKVFIRLRIKFELIFLI